MSADVPMSESAVDAWTRRLVQRHTAALTRPEFLKAVRALSVRYVERRSELSRRSPMDSAGKRAAFAACFAPLHFFTMSALVRALHATVADVTEIVDLGCGTGVASAAWALAFDARPQLVGIDRNHWALAEAEWNWQQLGIRGRTRPASFVHALVRRVHGVRDLTGVALLLAWSVNELDDDDRRALLAALRLATAAGATVLIVEPLSRMATPWWRAWADEWQTAGGRADEWKLDVPLPPLLDEIREAAGFRGDRLGARTIWIPGSPNRRATIAYGPESGVG